MPNFDTFMEELHNYVKNTGDPSSKKYKFQESFDDFAEADEALDEVQDAFFAERHRQAASGRHGALHAAKAEPAS